MNTRYYYTAVAAVVLLATIAGYLLFPGSQDVAWLYYYGRRYESSRELFADYFKFWGESSKSAVVPQVLIDLETAHVDEAILKVEEYLDQNPSDYATREYLGELYKKASRPNDYIRNLESLYAEKPTDSLLRELSQFYKQNQEYGKQLKTLESLVEAGKAEPRDYLDLMELLAVEGNPHLALQAMHLAFEKIPLSEVPESSILFATTLLIDNNQTLEAFVTASNYVLDRPVQFTTLLTLSTKFLNADAVREAEFFAELVPASEQEAPEYMDLTLSIVEREEGEAKAYASLRSLYENQHLSLGFYPQLIKMALKEGDFELVGKVFEAKNIYKLPPSEIVLIIRDLILFRQAQLAAKMQKSLGAEYLSSEPLIAFGLELAVNQRKSLGELDRIKAYPVNQKIYAAEFLQASGYQELASQILKEIPSFQEVYYENLDNAVELYIEVGLAEQAAQMLLDYTPPPGIPEGDITNAKLYILAFEGNLKEIELLLMKKKKGVDQTLADIYLIAEKANQKEAALGIANKLVSRRPIPKHEIFQARALAMNGKPREAMAILKRLKREGNDVEEGYFYVLVVAAPHSEVYRHQLQDYIGTVLQNPRLSEQKKRDYGYYLIGRGLKAEAEPIYRQLAAGQNYLNPDVQTLLDIYGEKITPEQIGWIVEQSRGKKGEELAYWMDHLIYRKRPDVAIALAEERGWNDPAVAFKYLEALEVTKNEGKIGEVVAELMEHVHTAPQFNKLGKVAYDLGFYLLGRQAYNRSLALDFCQPDAQKHLGIISYILRDFHSAKFWLELYLQSENPDFIGYFFYGDIFWYYRHWEAARSVFTIALNLLQKEPTKDYFTEVMEAELLFRLDHWNESIMIFEDLLLKYPNRSALRVDYANILRVMDRNCRAGCMLAEALQLPSQAPDLQPIQARREELDKELAVFAFLVHLNRFCAAQRYLDHLVEKYPQEPLVMVAQAELDYEMGRWYSAVSWYQIAIAFEPWNEAFKKAQREIFCERKSFFGGGIEYRLTGNFQKEVISDYVWHHRLNYFTCLILRGSTDELTLAGSADPITGIPFDFHGARPRLDVVLRREYVSGLYVDYMLFFNQWAMGTGLTAMQKDNWGRWLLDLWYHRQSWEFTQTVIDYGVEDRVRFTRYVDVGPRTEIFGGGGYRWWTLKTFGHAAETYTFAAGINYRLPNFDLIDRRFGDAANVFLNYYVDAEYPTWEKKVFSPVLQVEVIPLDVIKRETHVWQVTVSKEHCPSLRWEAFLGASWDRAFPNRPAQPTYGFVGRLGCKCGPKLILSYLHSVSTQFATQTQDRFIASFEMPY